MKNNKVHRELDTSEVMRAFGYALILTIFFAMVLVYVRQCILKARIEDEVIELFRSRDQLVQINHHLHLERGYLMSLPRIERNAREQLGFVDPGPAQLVILTAESLVKDE
jgi:cell division protein FtsL